MKKILGLDLGTNSIGWALIEQNLNEKQGKIINAGTRIIPMSQDILGKFDSGQSISQTAGRTGFRGIRRLRERHLLRRERLHRILNILGFLPYHYAEQIDFDKCLGQFIPETEPKLPYKFNIETNKADFIFKRSFDEMVQDFAKHQPKLVDNNKKVPYDWTIYYLRKKALSQKIEKEELAWLLLNFNQKRGYYQLRGEEDEDATKTAKTRKYFTTQKIQDIIDTNEVWKGLKVLIVKLADGNTGKIFKKEIPEWVGIERNIIATVDLDKEGKDKIEESGMLSQRFSIPTDEEWDKEWKLVKIKTENEIKNSLKTVGTYIYDSLLQNPNQKIKGKLVRVIERKFYKQELETILKKQKEYHPELSDKNLYESCIEELYKSNEGHRQSVFQKDFTYLFLNDIIFYQRPLKSKKSLISNCKFESKSFTKDGKIENVPLKCIAKSHPLFQEFRLWQFVHNLRIYQKEKQVDGKLQTDVNVTGEFLQSEEDWINLYDWLNKRKEIDQKAFLKYPSFNLKKNIDDFRWNYVEDKIYPCNETRAQIITRLEKLESVPADFLTNSRQESLWHILYSVEDKNDIQKALNTFAQKNGLGEDFAEQFKKFPPFKKEYGSYSTKAIKKLLPLMRTGNYWDAENIDVHTKERIEKIITGEYDKTIRNRVREKAIALNDLNDFKGLPVWLASYIVYNRHSEDGESLKWKTADDITLLDQHSLRNPIVEQVINETLQVVRDIWKQHGKGKENFFNEIHIELGREMKNPSEKRKKMTNQINENENTNLRIKALLTELLNDKNIENVRPFSPMQQEILKIYEEGALSAEENIPDEILKISKQAQPTAGELTRYKLWLEQKYRSPYTNKVIPLNKLFTPSYEIEHIIPQSRYFDNSFSNKVICESAVNKDKDNCTAFEYILKQGGKIIELGFGETATILDKEAYEKNIKESYAKSRSKMKKLLMEDIPESFIQRQLNDSRYISKVVKNLMSNIVREEGEQEAISKNVIASNGSITSTLKQDWGLNDVWNDIITPRFERLNELTQSNHFGEWTNKNGKKVFQTQVPLELQKGFSKKRIDHRHHTLDAIIIACATRNHINYLNNESALGKGTTKEEKEKKRHDLKNKLCFKKYNDDTKQNYKWMFHKPWETFTQEAREALCNTVVSFKQNLRVINKTVNNYRGWKNDENGKPVQGKIKQTKGENWAIRKSLHKDTVSGLVQLKLKKIVTLSSALDNWEMITDKDLKKQVKKLVKENYDKKKLIKYFKNQDFKWQKKDISKVEIYYWDKENVASRVKVDESFYSPKIESITDTGIQRIMFNHLQKYNEEKNGKITEHPELAFSPDGIDEMNKNIIELNGGKKHQPVYKVRTYESKGNKFNVGTTGNKKDKFVETAKGTNLFFAIYSNEQGERIYETIPLNIIIERIKQNLSPVPEINENGKVLLFYLSPNDLVYVPECDEGGKIIEEPIHYGELKKKEERIYKMVSCTEGECHFVPHKVAAPIVEVIELGSNNKSERAWQKEVFNKKKGMLDGAMIKSVCIKLRTDRLGNIQPAGTKSFRLTYKYECE
ncbi:MAG: type II CRISPR RNA-guided endonuclease Cas9 [Cytophagaceae bacterium]|nr:type II CRISPR RNA-guided endonuclease Cas9 [Cytophagaceae bacterium]